jgi:hypothetical protein
LGCSYYIQGLGVGGSVGIQRNSAPTTTSHPGARWDILAPPLLRIPSTDLDCGASRFCSLRGYTRSVVKDRYRSGIQRQFIQINVRCLVILSHSRESRGHPSGVLTSGVGRTMLESSIGAIWAVSGQISHPACPNSIHDGVWKVDRGCPLRHVHSRQS